MAIDDLLDEHEQGERVRSWLRKNGVSLIGGVALGLAAILGWRWWQQQHSQGLAEANGRYQLVVKDIQSKQLDKAAKDIAALDAGKGSVYSDLAALQLAKAQVDAGKNDEAIKTLQAVPAEGQFKLIVNQRLAQLLLDGGKADEAIKLLADAQDSTSLEIRGDALSVLGKRDEAREAYSKALASLDEAAPQRRVLETKLVDAGGNVPAPSQTI